ncbi:MAG TPA: hypothetical protein VKZ53_08050 [Candidatus Angelobacter sp.]|nr:hypothetical protein [Candidatus Angelobacter sp.]
MQPFGRILGLRLVCFTFGACLALGQSRPISDQTGNSEADLPALMKQDFGPNFTLPAKFPTPMITGDFDGDGVEDAAIVVDIKDPFPDSYEYKYKVADPYHEFFGFGNPSETAAFTARESRNSHSIVVIFGAGADNWRTADPKAKFVLVNVPFDTVETGRMLVKKNKPPIFVIKAVEAELMDANVFWDAKRKRWRWEPGATAD